MKQKLTAMLLVLACWAAAAQPVSTVVTCPGEDASQSMRISWAAPAKGYYVKYSAVGNEGNTVTLRPETEFRCTTFDGVNSKAADGSDMVEQAVITKCGATLKNLQPNTRYSYVICDPSGNAACPEHRFITAGAAEWQCCVISDFHAYTPLQHRQDARAEASEMILKVEPGS